jgi:hypothetical protein
LADLLCLQAAGAQRPDGKGPAAKSVIHLFLPGGLPQQETFDPKPYAPIEYRGDFGVVSTKTGDLFGNSLPRLAACADRLTVIRSMTHADAAHERGTHQMFTGYAPSPAVSFPSIGSVVSHELGPRNHLPPYVCIPFMPNEYAGSGYLSAAYAPFSVGGDPALAGFQVRDVNPPADVSPERSGRQRRLLAIVGSRFLSSTSSDDVSAMQSFYERAHDLVDSAAAREAFCLDQEPAAIRDRYGRHPAGQRLLMARRLVAAGVRLVTVVVGNWDLHTNVAAGIRSQTPAVDQALSSLLEDLDASGQLAETIVMVTTEFGRTPKINATAGRDHWPRVFSVVLSGGGFQRGLVYGASNATAAEPADDPVSPADLAATVYHQLGIDASRELMAPGDRPIEIVKDGRVIRELLA